MDVFISKCTNRESEYNITMEKQLKQLLKISSTSYLVHFYSRMSSSFYRKRQEIPASLVAYSIKYKSETIKLYTWKNKTNIWETHLKNKLVFYLAIDGRERFKEALNQIAFLNSSILIICKSPPVEHIFGMIVDF